MQFIDSLKHSLEQRTKHNPSYSLRAFARDLNVDASNMSKMISGKLKPQKETQKRLLLKLGYSVEEIKKIIASKDRSFDEQFNHLNIDSFEIVSEWYHDAILELTRLSFFQPNTKWIAKTLDISEVKIKLAIDRLEKLGWLKIDSAGWHDLSGDNTTNMDSDYTNQALKNLQISLLEKSIESVKTDPVEKRNHTSTMVTIDENDIPEVKKRIKTFRKDLTSFLERSSSKANNLYQLQIGLFSLINKE